MTQYAIQVDNLGKAYRLAHQGAPKESYQSLRDALVRGVRDTGRKVHRVLKGSTTESQSREEEYWALQDVSFSIRPGERVGIIGRNGAGKSTLLKVLSRITEPTQGRIKIVGRVASLLEVGTGFHPELTGRENIFLNGAILGMTRKEIIQQFDAIVDFAEVEKFLDTPVKRYSSGMYVRLAFAVAAHLDPEILVVDEVLAVGDVAFQKKCLTRMNEVGASGRTVIFVSHNMGAIQQLCNSALLLEGGKLVYRSDDVQSAIQRYLTSNNSNGSAQWMRVNAAYDNPYFAPAKMYVVRAISPSDSAIPTNECFQVHIEGMCEVTDPALQVGISVFADDGTLLFWSYTTDSERAWVDITQGPNHIVVEIPPHILNEGEYFVEMGVALFHRSWLCQPGVHAPKFRLKIEGGFISSKYWTQRRPGILAPVLDWNKA